MELNLKGKIALVTGSSRGIGAGIAKSLHHEGCTVILNSRKTEDLKKFESEFKERVDHFACDVSLISDCEKLKEYIEKKYGKIDILVLNVGSGKSAPLGEEKAADWETSLSSNLFPVVHLVEVLRPMLEKSSTVTTIISSICGIEYIPAPATYTTIKSALHAYAKTMSKFFARSGGRVNVVSPGNILFEGSTWETKLSQNKTNVEEYISKEVPLNRFGRPDEIGDLVVYLSSSRATFITGANFVIDGGQTNIIH